MPLTDPSQLIAQFLVDADRLGAVVAAGGDWSGASPCEGWTATDVLDHIISTERGFFSQHGVDLGAEPTGEPTERWRAHLAVLPSVLTEKLVTTKYDGYFGATTIGESLRDFYAFDLLVHRWDLGTGLGQAVEFTDEELERIESRIPEPGDPTYQAFYSEGICHDPLPVPAQGSRQVAVLAKLGRRA
jgi:uncharacterized protein (TIGR03083 family)